MINLTHTTASTHELKITLKEITDLLSVQHSKAMKKVEELTKESGFGEVSKIDTLNLNRVKVTTYLLNKKQAIAVGAKLNNALLMKVIDRLEELEAPKNPSLPQNYVEALEALTVSVKENIKLSNSIKVKNELILTVADLNIKSGDVLIGDFAKNLAIEGMGQNNVFKWLKARGYLMEDTKPYQQYVSRGYFVRKPSKNKINGEVRYTTMLTAKGTVWLARLIKADFEISEGVA